MNEVLQEFCDSRNVPVRVDHEKGVLRGVKILGFHSRNGRRYRPKALVEAATLYEGAKVNVNHPKGSPLSPRDYQDRIGVIRGVDFRPREGIFGDLHFNPKHTLAEQLIWDAEHATENVGFSHNVVARTSREASEVIVEEITQVTSVDLVADPATTRGLFESRSNDVELGANGCGNQEIEELTCEKLKDARPDLVEQLVMEQSQEVLRMREQLDEMHEKETVERHRGRAMALIREHGLPDPDSSDPAARAIVGPEFVASLLACNSDSEIRRLVEERALLVASALRWQNSTKARKPISRDQHLVTEPPQKIDTGAEFAKLIT